MSIETRFIGCLHLGHPSIAHRRGFQDEFYHDEHLIESWNKVVRPKDITYILGDVTMEKTAAYYQLDRLNGIKHVVLGNHDKKNHIPELLKYVASVSGAIDYKGCILTHIPIHPCEVSYYRANIHAHIHYNKLWEVETSDSYLDEGHKIVPTLHKYINVDAHRINYTPRTLEELFKENNNG